MSINRLVLYPDRVLRWWILEIPV